VIRLFDRIAALTRVNGARGAAMFFFGVMALVFAMAFTGPWKVIPPPPSGLVLLNDFVPLEVWGVGWLFSGLVLIIGAFRKNQAWAMGSFASMLFVWFASYLTTAIVQTVDSGYSRLWYVVTIYGSLLGAVVSVARLINAPPPSTLDAVITGEIELTMKDPGDDS
jgi:hypothetical protein